ncbi:HTH domain-containing protein [Lysinibacillus cavernae]|uniref:HTH domain-containing protein n=1 Tax=Lysinibacillus cavernae TaxID=2666135 RepID=UPI0012D8F9BA|nr:HTH domain-containing protein [Lysinibacillus cavernae]
MAEFNDNVAVSFVSNVPHLKYLKDEIQELAEKFNFNYQQLSKIIDLPINEIENFMNSKGTITIEQQEKIENKLAILNHGFESFDARERVSLLLNDLIADYMFSTESISKIIHVEEKELANFRRGKLLTDRNEELKICVNVIMLHFVLHD